MKKQQEKKNLKLVCYTLFSHLDAHNIGDKLALITYSTLITCAVSYSFCGKEVVSKGGERISWWTNRLPLEKQLFSASSRFLLSQRRAWNGARHRRFFKRRFRFTHALQRSMLFFLFVWFICISVSVYEKAGQVYWYNRKEYKFCWRRSHFIHHKNLYTSTLLKIFADKYDHKTLFTPKVL